VIEVWRLVRTRFCSTPTAAFAGEGAALAGGRWNRKGTRVVYASCSRSLAIVEILASIERAEAPDDYAFASASFAQEELAQLPSLPPEWRRPARCEATIEIGERFVAESRALALAIPSVIVPQEFNYLINPLHPRFSAIKIGKALEPFAFDSRIFV
jgi:RES domain-containing protein